MAVMPSVNNRMHAETLREVARSNYRLQDIQCGPAASLGEGGELFDIVWDDPLGLAFASEGGTPGTKFAGGHRSRVTPVPIPNTEVKPATADGTAWETVWESRSLPALSQIARELRFAGFRMYAGSLSGPAHSFPCMHGLLFLWAASQARRRCGRVGRCRHYLK